VFEEIFVITRVAYHKAPGVMLGLLQIVFYDWMLQFHLFSWHSNHLLLYEYHAKNIHIYLHSLLSKEISRWRFSSTPSRHYPLQLALLKMYSFLSSAKMLLSVAFRVCKDIWPSLVNHAMIHWLWLTCRVKHTILAFQQFQGPMTIQGGGDEDIPKRQCVSQADNTISLNWPHHQTALSKLSAASVCLSCGNRMEINLYIKIYLWIS
jgi:hypothetical protein